MDKWISAAGGTARLESLNKRANTDSRKMGLSERCRCGALDEPEINLEIYPLRQPAPRKVQNRSKRPRARYFSWRFWSRKHTGSPGEARASGIPYGTEATAYALGFPIIGRLAVPNSTDPIFCQISESYYVRQRIAKYTKIEVDDGRGRGRPAIPTANDYIGANDNGVKNTPRAKYRGRNR